MIDLERGPSLFFCGPLLDIFQKKSLEEIRGFFDALRAYFLMCFWYLFLNLSILPAVSTKFIFPV